MTRSIRIPLLLTHLLLATLLLAAAAGTSGAQGSIAGRVLSRGAPIPHAQVALDGTRLGAVVDSGGAFHVAAVPPGRYTLRARAIGFAPGERVIDVVAGERTHVSFELAPTESALSAIVTTATLKETFVAESPVKVEVLTAAVLQRNASNNLMDNISFVNGLVQQVDCGVCFTNSIRINGMEGPYTAVLIDGTPLMSALATVYGFNGIDPSIIQQVEIIKGPNSTLYGSEAMGGVINIVTKDPRFAPSASINAFATSNGETNLDVAVAPVGTGLLLSGNVAYNDRFVDENGDDFSDLPLTRRAALFGKWSLGTAANRTFDLMARYYDEDRFGGTSAWTRADRGSSEVYGESIRTRRAELVGSRRFGGDARPLRLDFAFNWHDQDSFYGDQPYVAAQTVAFAQLLWNLPLDRHDLMLGATLRHQRYRDSTAFHETRDERLTPGLFVQDELAIGEKWTMLGGMRVDVHEAHGLIPSPRLALKWTADEHTTLRFNAATGFRVVSLFTEDHAALTGARDVVIAGELDPERSVNATASLNRIFHVLGTPDALVLDVDLFYTRFSNRIVADYDRDPNLIVYENLDGHAVTRGISAGLGYDDIARPLSGSVGVTLQDAYLVEGGAKHALPHAARVQGVLSLAYELAAAGLTIDYTARALGPMRLPAFEGLPSRSPWIGEHHLQLTKALGDGAQVYVGVKNLLDYVQRDAIVDPGNPFGDRFDTSRVYGPLQGRRLMVGARYAVSR